MRPFLTGAACLGWAIAALFFLRFWRSSHDRFFLLFAASFALFAVERLVATLLDPMDELQPYVYLIRLLAFLVLLGAIIDKNRVRKP